MVAEEFVDEALPADDAHAGAGDRDREQRDARAREADGKDESRRST